MFIFLYKTLTNPEMSYSWELTLAMSAFGFCLFAGFLPIYYEYLKVLSAKRTVGACDVMRHQVLTLSDTTATIQRTEGVLKTAWLNETSGRLVSFAIFVNLLWINWYSGYVLTELIFFILYPIWSLYSSPYYDTVDVWPIELPIKTLDIPSTARKFRSFGSDIRPICQIEDYSTDPKDMHMSMLPGNGKPTKDSVYRKSKLVLYEVQSTTGVKFADFFGNLNYIVHFAGQDPVYPTRYLLVDQEHLVELTSAFIIGPNFDKTERIDRAEMKMSGGIRHVNLHRKIIARTGMNIYDHTMALFTYAEPFLRSYEKQALN